MKKIIIAVIAILTLQANVSFAGVPSMQEFCNREINTANDIQADVRNGATKENLYQKYVNYQGEQITKLSNEDIVNTVLQAKSRGYFDAPEFYSTRCQADYRIWYNIIKSSPRKG